MNHSFYNATYTIKVYISNHARKATGVRLQPGHVFELRDAPVASIDNFIRRNHPRWRKFDAKKELHIQTDGISWQPEFDTPHGIVGPIGSILFLLERIVANGSVLVGFCSFRLCTDYFNQTPLENCMWLENAVVGRTARIQGMFKVMLELVFGFLVRWTCAYVYAQVHSSNMLTCDLFR